MQKPSVVFVSEELVKAIRKGTIPVHIVNKFFKWKADVVSLGIREVRKIPGYHDEPLKGSELGRRSVLLNQAWRLFYVENIKGECIVVAVEDINKHDYR